MHVSGTSRLAPVAAILILTALVLPAMAQTVPSLYTQGRVFNITDHIVSTSVFCWYTATGGQLSGPWLPLDGRPNWTGTSAWWQGQIKQIMMANIDVMWVHLVPDWEPQRYNLFTALNQLRAQGYDVPKVAPFLDPMITWSGMPLVDLATTTGKDTFVWPYTRFFQQYYSVNLDPYADTYIEQIDGKVVLDTWHVKNNVSNLNSLTRDDVESRLRTALYPAHPVFNNGIRMVTNAYNVPTLSFADEKVLQFEMSVYNLEVSYYNGVETVRTVQLKGGYWDQNVRSPGQILKRNGGNNYRNAWNAVNRATTTRAYIESWNEYDEGSGIYAAVTIPPYCINGNTSTDTWSSTNDPYEYIHTTATGAASFNDTPSLGAKPLWNNILTQMRSGSTASAKIIMRNDGDLSWNSASGLWFGQDRGADSAVFCASDCTIDDSTNEIPIYGGIFRGRPIEFNVEVTAPSTAGTYVTHWGMANSSGRFGEQALVTIEATGSPVPIGPTPTDVGFATRVSSIVFSWIAVVDPEAGTAGYNCRVGTTPGGSDVFSGFVGIALSKTITGTNGNTYYCQVQVVANDGCAGPWSNGSDGIILDTTRPPAAATPVDGGLYTQSTEITFTWTPVQDDGSGTSSYFCQIGTTPGGYDILNGDIGNVLSKAVTVTPRRTYYCRICAKDGAGNLGVWSGASDGIGVVDAADEPVGLAKTHTNGTWIGLTLPVSAAFSNVLYVQDSNRVSGIAILSPVTVLLGGLVQVYGALGTANGERVISALGVRGI